MLYRSFGADFTTHRREIEISWSKISPFSIGWTCVDHTQNLAGVVIRDVRNELEGVRERTNNETVITTRGSAVSHVGAVGPIDVKTAGLWVFKM